MNVNKLTNKILFLKRITHTYREKKRFTPRNDLPHIHVVVVSTLDLFRFSFYLFLVVYTWPKYRGHLFYNIQNVIVFVWFYAQTTIWLNKKWVFPVLMIPLKKPLCKTIYFGGYFSGRDIFFFSHILFYVQTRK